METKKSGQHDNVGKKTDDVFISYSRIDSRAVSRIKKELSRWLKTR